MVEANTQKTWSICLALPCFALLSYPQLETTYFDIFIDYTNMTTFLNTKPPYGLMKIPKCLALLSYLQLEITYFDIFIDFMHKTNSLNKKPPYGLMKVPKYQSIYGPESFIVLFSFLTI